MKAQKKVNVVLIILVILLISIISFIGIFYQDKNKMANYIPDYTLGTDLSGYRKVVLTVDDSSEENTDELKNYDNYVKSANIIDKRLHSMNVSDYTVRCDESTGQIELTLPENMQTDYILADITQKGKFEIKDENTDEVLMNNDDIKNVKIQSVQSTYSQAKTVYMDIHFDGQGSKKFKDITKNYQNVIANETATSNEVTNENTATNETTNEVDETENTTETETENTAKEVSLNIDGTSMMTTTFSEVVDNGILSLSLGSASSNDELKTLMYQAESLAAILENGEMPLQYEVTGNLYVSASVEQSQINILIYIGIAIAIIMFVVAIVKYKGKGLAISLASIGFVAFYLLVLRYANVIMTLEGILAIGLVFIINYVFCIMFLNGLKKNVEKSFTKTLQKFSTAMIPMLIFSVVCCFANWMPIFSFGMVLFWGLVISVIYNFVITQLLIKNLGK